MAGQKGPTNLNNIAKRFMQAHDEFQARAKKAPGEPKAPPMCPTCNQAVPDGHQMPPEKAADLKASDQD